MSSLSFCLVLVFWKAYFWYLRLQLLFRHFVVSWGRIILTAPRYERPKNTLFVIVWKLVSLSSLSPPRLSNRLNGDSLAWIIIFPFPPFSELSILYCTIILFSWANSRHCVTATIFAKCRLEIIFIFFFWYDILEQVLYYVQCRVFNQ